jgi:hypothetical protein
MAESTILVPDSGTKKLHTFQRTIGANSVEDEVVIPGEHYLASYVVMPAAAVTCANAGDDIAQVMAGATLNVRIRRIRLEQAGLITAAAATTFLIARVTTAGTGGTAITPSKMDNGDAASGATSASGVPTATHGTIGTNYFTRTIFPVQTAPAGGLALAASWEWVQHPGMKPLIIPAGITNGFVIRNQGARAGLTVNFEIEFTESSFL